MFIKKKYNFSQDFDLNEIKKSTTDRELKQLISRFTFTSKWGHNLSFGYVIFFFIRAIFQF
jgi:hypothetical protein